MRSLLLALIVLSIEAPRVLAWGNDGHLIVCEIAWREVAEETRVAIRDLLSKEPEPTIFSASCLWADEKRSDPAFDYLKPLHFVNLDRHQPGIDQDAACSVKGCALKAIDEYAAVLSSRERPVGERLIALKMLGHVVGDLHQPLHVGYGDDSGGNSVKVRFFGEEWSGRTRWNLHKVWDTGLIDHLARDWKKLAERLRSGVSPIDRELWLRGSPVQWAEESYQWTEDVVYRLPTDRNVGWEYFLRNAIVVETQLMKGGLRLASLLNRSFASE